jgi:hypothetical protein
MLTIGRRAALQDLLQRPVRLAGQTIDTVRGQAQRGRGTVANDAHRQRLIAQSGATAIPAAPERQQLPLGTTAPRRSKWPWAQRVGEVPLDARTQRVPMAVEPKFLNEQHVHIESRQRLQHVRQPLADVGQNAHRQASIEGRHLQHGSCRPARIATECAMRVPCGCSRRCAVQRAGTALAVCHEVLQSSFTLIGRAQRRLACGVLLLSFAVVGCTSSAYVEAEAPVAVETYPSTYYDGHVVYWIGDRWYFRRGGAWVYYRTEPVYLHDHRHGWGGYYRPPPPYYRSRPHYYRPHYYQPHRQAAPPARRSAPAAGRRR